ncbi:MAG: helix-turn-helix transcriptional regulator [Clostridiaceae bacterium]|nr:helix-turn-helix transcriptional regulator [Clostridiaceae bacterium]
MPKTIYSKEHQSTAARIKQARIEAGISQEEAAKLLGRTQSYISKIEAGQRRIDVNLLADLAKIYNKRADYFFSA